MYTTTFTMLEFWFLTMLAKICTLFFSPKNDYCFVLLTGVQKCKFVADEKGFSRVKKQFNSDVCERTFGHVIGKSR